MEQPRNRTADAIHVHCSCCCREEDRAVVVGGVGRCLFMRAASGEDVTLPRAELCSLTSVQARSLPARASFANVRRHAGAWSGCVLKSHTSLKPLWASFHRIECHYSATSQRWLRWFVLDTYILDLRSTGYPVRLSRRASLPLLRVQYFVSVVRGKNELQNTKHKLVNVPNRTVCACPLPEKGTDKNSIPLSISSGLLRLRAAF